MLCKKLLNRPVNIRFYGSITVSNAKSGPDNFEEEYEKLKIPTSPLKKCLLGLGSGIMSLVDPSRGDMIALMGETTGEQAAVRCRNLMTKSEEGRNILLEKPRINSSTVDIEKLGLLDENTLGKAYYNFLKRYGYTPDARLAVRYIEDTEIAYVVQRYREVHDLVHTVLNMPTNMLGEVTVKWVEAIQTRMPMCATGALFGAIRLAPKCIRAYSTQVHNKPNVSLDNKFEEDLHTRTSTIRKHPGTLNLSCQKLPSDLLKIIQAVIKERNIPNLESKASSLANYLHSRKPPFENAEIYAAKRKFTADVQNCLPQGSDNMSEEESIYYQKLINHSVTRLMRSRLYHWKPVKYDDVTSYSYLRARSASDYAVVSRVLNEIYKREGSFKPQSLFDFGSGVGTVSWVAHGFWHDSIKEYFTVDSSPEMNDLALKIVHENDLTKKPLLGTLYQRQFLPAAPRIYDLVTCAYALFELPNANSRLEVLSNLWNKTGQFLVLIEQGTLAGYRLIVEARDFLLHLSKKQKVPVHVFAPCPHELSCPRLASSTPCNFLVKYFPINLTSEENSSSAELFSYVIIKKGDRNEEVPNWPRLVRETLLRHQHAICRTCTASGNLQEFIFTPSKHGKLLYKCARFSRWGDLLPISHSGNGSVEVSDSLSEDSS